ncbi:Methyl-accepting chemotaxis protein 4 [Anaerohalosphaera lusitana]|uniref:histidine kinase n=1 Tax=Anaerohalosphaera lusitana TaxID=1936003 RepID=A0A1U9NGX0_9BACT|nr:cache domain-containing protein [Anaerohalosphaera lusitana]AQT66998.1 Methyl-accepting chemotaxis protein 4 [Anaerohalosphaera lusitana]
MTDIKRFIAGMPLHYKLFCAYTMIFASIWLVSTALVYAMAYRTISARVDSELSNTTTALRNLVETCASTAIKNTLKASAQRNREMISSIYAKALKGEISMEQAKAQCTEILLSQKIGSTGYLYCVDSKGIVQVHPFPGVLGRDVSEYNFIKQQIKKKQGYIEYDWRNPGDPAARPKALYMTYFEPWDWIISASSYRSEFLDLVNVDDFRDTVLALNFGKSGYSFVVDVDGNMIIHPKTKGNFSDTDSIKTILREKEGTMRYKWQNPDEHRPREKIVCFMPIPEYGWFVGSSGYVDEMYAPISRIRNVLVITFITGVAAIIALSLWLSSIITKPLSSLTDRVVKACGEEKPECDLEQRNEIRKLTDCFNCFVVKIEDYQSKLKESLAQKEEAMHQLSITNEELEEIVFASSHDLRSPLVSLAGFSHELEVSCGKLQEMISNTHCD